MCLHGWAMRKHTWIPPLLALIIVSQLLCIPTALTATAANETSEWRGFRHDPNHSGYTSGNSVTNSSLPLWNFTTLAPVQSSPAVVDGLVFVGSRDYNIYCVNASTGQAVWHFKTAGSVDTSPAVYGGCVYVGSDDGWFYCIDIATGVPRWISLVGGKADASPVIADGLVYVASGKQGLYCFNATDGVLVWTASTSVPVKSSPAVWGGILYVAMDDFFVHAFNASTGGEIWSEHTGSVTSSPCVYGGYVYVGSYDGYVCCLDAYTGQKVWQYLTENGVSSSPAVAYGHVYVGSEDNNLYCFNASDGKKVWQAKTGYWIHSSPVVAGGNVYVGSQDYSLYCFDAYTGEKRWSYATAGYVDSSPAIVDGTLFVGSSDGYLYAFALTNSSGSIPQQPSDLLAWSTVAFDVIAFGVAAGLGFTLIRTAYFSRRTKQTEPTALPSQKTSWVSAHFDGIVVLALLALSTVFFINLGSGPLWAADEQTYSQWAYHMVKSGDYLTPNAFGGLAVWIGKPPLYMWLMSLSYQAFGVSNFVTRLWSPIFAALTLIMVYFLGKQLYNRYVGLGAALVLATFSTFYLFARHAMTDVTFIFFLVASLYFFVLSQKTEKINRYLVLGGLFFGLALMTKQVEALLIPLILFGYLLATKRSIRFLFSKQFTVFWGVGALVLLPWLLYMAVSFGSNFYDWFVVYCGFERTLTPLEGHQGDALFYFSYLAEKETFWAVFLPFAVGLSAFNFVFKRSKSDALVLAWMVVVFLVFTVAQTKLSWYLLPAFPAFALALSGTLYQAGVKLRLYWKQRLVNFGK